MSIWESNLLKTLREHGDGIDRLKAELVRAQSCIRRLRARENALSHQRGDMLSAMQVRYRRLEQYPHKYGFRLAMYQVGLSMPNAELSFKKGAKNERNEL